MVMARMYDPNTQPKYELAKEGEHDGVIVDLQDLGMVENRTYGKMEHKIKVVVELAQRNSKGRPIYASYRRTNSLHPKAQLPKDIRRITGITPTSDLNLDEVLLGRSVKVLIAHKVIDNQTYQRVEEIWKGDGSYEASGEYRPWETATFDISRTSKGESGSGKPYLNVFDGDGSVLTVLWNVADMMVAASSPQITCSFREKGDGTIKIKEGSVRAVGATE